MEKIKIIYNPVDSEASSCQRVIYPLLALADAGLVEAEVINTNDIRAQLKSADLVVLQCVIGPQQHQLIDYIHKQGKRVIIDYDDVFSHLPEKLLQNLGMKQDEITNNWIKYLKTADAISVPTPTLAELVKNHTNKPVHIIPNYIPRKDYEASQEYTPFDATEEIRIVYSCSESHSEDFKYIGPVLRQLGETYSKVTIISQGGLEFGYHFWDYKGRTIHETKTSYGGYYSMLRRLKPHIFIAPLKPTQHNIARSGLKYLQAGSIKAAFVGSYLPDIEKQPYNIVKNNETGFLVTKKSEWWSLLSDLVERPESIKKIGEAAYSDAANYILEDHIGEWHSIYTQLVN